MFHLVLFEPEIPANTGNIIRLTANTGIICHLIEPLGFELSDKQCRRAGLDYHEWACVQRHGSFEDFLEKTRVNQLWFLTTQGKERYDSVPLKPGDAFILGPESRGLPKVLLGTYPSQQWLYLPQQPHSRSLNLSNVAAIVIYEAWRQNNFSQGA